jgi:uncharacterized protein DUF397
MTPSPVTVCQPGTRHYPRDRQCANFGPKRGIGSMNVNLPRVPLGEHEDDGGDLGGSAAGARRRSSHCHGSADCVEITVTTDTSRWPHKADCDKLYLMRDTKNPDGPVLAFTPAEWEAFVLGVKDGEFDISDGEFENSP